MTQKSVLGKTWHIKKANEHHVSQILQNIDGLSDIAAKLLALKGLTADNALSFLHPKLKDSLPDPFHLVDMDKAVNRMIAAITNKEKICIFGDYDVDGATSSAMLKKFFSSLSCAVEVYIPDRILEGYGPSNFAIQNIKDTGATLLITVDCGGTAYEPLAYADDIGLDVIVIDHHIMVESPPKAVAVINPNRLDETTQYTYLAAVGVSFLFMIAVSTKLKQLGTIEEINLMQYLDLVAFGTVCDVMPLTGLNRTFVTQGLKVLASRNNIGLKILSDIARLNESPTAYHLGFILGPRINAGGRVGKASLGSALLSTDSEEAAYKIAIELEQFNEERKLIEKQVLEEAMIITEPTQQDKNIVFVYKEGWHPGVIGIVASKLKEKYQKPVAVIGINDGIGKASCRSVKGVDFGNKILEAKLNKIVEAGGGHAMAAGFTILPDKIEELHSFLNKAMEKEYLKFLESTYSEYDVDLTTNSLNLELVNEVYKLAPFGNGNAEPLFRLHDVYIISPKIVGEKHISSILVPSYESYANRGIKAIAFGALENNIGEILLNNTKKPIAVIGYAQRNFWNGQYNVQFIITDIIQSPS